MNKRLLVTGGLGYIGSHTVLKLLKADFDIVIIDNLVNSKMTVLEKLINLSGKPIEFIQGDITEPKFIQQIFLENEFSSIIHFAGLKSVSESEEFPEKYYETNVRGTQNLLDAFIHAGGGNFIFSSSATVYGDPGYAKCSESTPVAPVSVYGNTKLSAEDLTKEAAQKNSNLKYGILRYFNPVGAHESGLIGEDPNGIPNNLMPYVSQVAVGKREKVNVWGNDYPTPDGTGRRDYIHVEDLASGHIAALIALETGRDSFTINLGTGNSYSVLEVITAFEKASGTKIPFEFAPRRPGDVAENYADPTLAKDLLGWSAKYDLNRMCEDAWRWQSQNPNGFE